MKIFTYTSLPTYLPPTSARTLHSTYAEPEKQDMDMESPANPKAKPQDNTPRHDTTRHTVADKYWYDRI
jgi:hypothetical protein